MKKLIILVFAGLISLSFNSSKIQNGEYWFDSDYTSRQPVAATGSSDLMLANQIDVSELFNGLHTVSFRFIDDNNKWSSPTTRFFIKDDATIDLLTSNIVAYEYWFDGNLSRLTTEQVSPLASLSFNELIDVTPLFKGLHTVHIRFKTKESWSSTYSHFFIKAETRSNNPTNKIAKIEYWFDTNLAIKITSDISDKSHITLSDQLNTDSLYEGLHTIHYRFMDKSNLWSSVVSRFFVNLDSSMQMSNNKTTQLEYWFDNNTSQTEIVETTGENLLLIKKVNTENLTAGLHTFSMRFMDAAQNYSSAVSQFFVKQTMAHQSNSIVAYRYWLNDSIIHAANIDLPESDITVLDSLNIRLYNSGEYMVNMQFKDSLGRWSSPFTDTITKLSYPFAQLTFDKTGGCPGEVVQFSAIVIDADSIIWDFSDNPKAGGLNVQHQFNNSGNYPITASLIDTIGTVVATFNTDSNIIIHPIPILNLIDSVMLLNDQTEVIDAGGTFSSFEWNGDSGDQTYLLSALDLGLGKHDLTLKVTNNFGCINADTIVITVKSDVGINAPFNTEIKLYPNPAKDFIRLKWNDASIQTLSASLIEANGKHVISEKEVVSDQSINVSNLKPGTYYMVLKMANMVYSIPIIKK